MRILSGALVALIILVATEAQVQYGDRWNYGTTIQRADGFIDYGPSEWGSISCDESTSEGLDACIAYTDKWHQGQGWTIKDNTCHWCPDTDTSGSCGAHRMSPINVERNRGLGFWNKTEVNNGNPGANADPMARECIDEHWMKYEVRILPIIVDVCPSGYCEEISLTFSLLRTLGAR